MADGKKEQDFDLENLSALKASLICSKCTLFPRPGTDIFACPKCCKIACSNCVTSNSLCGECTMEIKCTWLHQNVPYPNAKFQNAGDKVLKKPFNFVVDKNLTRFASIFKIHPCIFLKNGCKDEFDVKDLAAHEKVCIFRNITCPSINCTSSIVFNSIMDHYENNHGNLEIKDEILKFDGNIETLKNGTFVLNRYGKPFFPQFYIKDNLLHFWIVGYTDDIVEASSYEVELAFFIRNGSSPISVTYDLVKDTKIDKKLLTSGNRGMIFSLKYLTEYFVRDTNEYKHHENIEFKLTIFCEKLDEIAKDENNESGVEDTDEEDEISKDVNIESVNEGTDEKTQIES